MFIVLLCAAAGDSLANRDTAADTRHTSAVSGVGSQGVSSGSSEHQQLWRPLLQPAFVEGLWLRVQGVWAEAGMLGAGTPRALLSSLPVTTQQSSSSQAAAAAGTLSSQTNGWAVSAFVAAMHLPSEQQLLRLHHQHLSALTTTTAPLTPADPAHQSQAALSHKAAAASPLSLPWLSTLDGAQLRACLGTSLQLSGVPYGEELRAALSTLRASPLWPRLQRVLQSGGSAVGESMRVEVACTALLPLLSAKMPDVPHTVLRSLTAACLPSLLV